MAPLTLLALTLAGLHVPPALAAVATATSDTNMVGNGSFEQGTTGWRTNGSNERLSSVAGGPVGSRYVRLTVTTPKTAALNDAVNTVQNTTAGQKYHLSAWVWANRDGVTGELAAREVNGSTVVRNAKAYSLDPNTWTKLDLDVTAKSTGSMIDLNVVAWQLRTDAVLAVDGVTLTRVTTSTAPAPAPAPTGCASRIPTGATLFGSSISTSGTTFEQAMNTTQSWFGAIPSVRIFEPGVPPSTAWERRGSYLAGKSVVTSFRPSPQEVLSGKHDAALLRWFKTTPTNVQSYWSYVHEPEPEIVKGRFTFDQYRRAWQRIAGLARQACKPNLHATLILTGWTTDPRSGRNWRNYYAGDAYIDAVAFDPYNGATTRPSSYPDPARLFDGVVKVAQSTGKPWGIAETGSMTVSGDGGTQRAAWLTKVGNYFKSKNPRFVTYFNSTNKGDFILDDTPSKTAWRKVIGN